MDPKIWELFTECCLVRLVAFLGGHHLYMSIFLYVCSCPSVCAQKCAFVCPPPPCAFLCSSQVTGTLRHRDIGKPGQWNNRTLGHWSPGQCDNIHGFHSWIFFIPPVCAFCSSFVPPIHAFCLPLPWNTGTPCHRNARSAVHWDTGTMDGVRVPTYRRRVVFLGARAPL